MINKFKAVVVVIAATAFLCMPANAIEGVRSLDGRLYAVKMASQGNPANKVADEYTFGNRMLKSKHFASFGDALCVISPVANATLFTAETRQTKSGKIKWIGAVKGDLIEATAIWYKSGSPPLIYIVKGNLNE